MNWQGETFELTVDRPGHGGVCVGRRDGRVIFVRDALPGERLVVRVTEDKGKSFCHAQIEEIVDALGTAAGFKVKKVKGMSDGFGGSDHESFYRKDVPILFPFTGLHPDYHRPTDDADKINYAGMARIADFGELLLLDVARRRFAARGWRNVQVLCQDATFFSLPEWDNNLVSARGAVRCAVPWTQIPRTCSRRFAAGSLFTLSYSLSMIPSYFALLDRIDERCVSLSEAICRRRH